MNQSAGTQRTNEGEAPTTVYQIQVAESVKGRVDGSQIAITQIGGDGLYVGGAVQFRVGEDAVILLEDRSAEGGYKVHGMKMGKLTVSQNVLAGPALEMDKLIANKKGESNKSQWTLEDLRKLVRDQEENRANPSAEIKKTMVTPTQPLPAPLAAVGKNSIENIQAQQIKKPASAEHSLTFWALLLGLPLLLLLGFLIWKMADTE